MNEKGFHDRKTSPKPSPSEYHSHRFIKTIALNHSISSKSSQSINSLATYHRRSTQIPELPTQAQQKSLLVLALEMPPFAQVQQSSQYRPGEVARGIESAQQGSGPKRGGYSGTHDRTKAQSRSFCGNKCA
jgi:hypothetical protein